MKLTEEQLNEMKSNYDGKPAQKLLNHLKRNYPTHEVNFDWMTSPIKMISVDEKNYHLAENKKYLTEKIFNLLGSEWASLGTPTIRKTIKYFLDGIK